ASTPCCAIPPSWPASSAATPWPASASPVPSSGCAAAGSTPTATVPAAVSGTRRSTVTTCSVSSPTSAAWSSATSPPFWKVADDAQAPCRTGEALRGSGLGRRRCRGGRVPGAGAVEQTRPARVRGVQRRAGERARGGRRGRSGVPAAGGGPAARRERGGGGAAPSGRRRLGLAHLPRARHVEGRPLPRPAGGRGGRRRGALGDGLLHRGPGRGRLGHAALARPRRVLG